MLKIDLKFSFFDLRRSLYAAQLVFPNVFIYLLEAANMQKQGEAGRDINIRAIKLFIRAGHMSKFDTRGAFRKSSAMPVNSSA